MSTESSPVDGLRDLVGEFVGELGALVPRFIERSRDQLAVVAKVIEQLPCIGALTNGTSSAEEPHTPDLRLVSGGADEAIEPDEAAEADAVGVETAPVVAKKAPAKRAPAKKAAAPARETSSAAARAGSSLAIPDYDELAASQVIPRLDSMSPDELEAIRLHETANRQRRTILSRVAQIQTG